MKKMEYEAFLGVRKWIIQHARPLELGIWNFLFEGGSKEEVLEVLALYQNEDGGFGQALEPDNWNPGSTPNATLYALDILHTINYYKLEDPIYQGILRYLESGKHQKEYGWMFSVPENENFPHAVWWNYNEEANIKESIGVTASFSAFILTVEDSGTALYGTALTYARNLISIMMVDDELGEMGVSGLILLVRAMEEKDLLVQEKRAVDKRLGQLVTGRIEHNLDNWKYYGQRPSSYIHNPESIFYMANKEITEKELKYLVETLPENDVWPITWTWFDNTKKYAKEFAVSEVWWKAIKAIEKLCFLREFHQISEKKEKEDARIQI